jgi:hypothetical protein
MKPRFNNLPNWTILLSFHNLVCLSQVGDDITVRNRIDWRVFWHKFLKNAMKARLIGRMFRVV